MSYEEITAMLAETGLPFAYHHFAEGESPEPPFLVYLIPGSNNFSADGQVWLKVKQLDIELYTDKKEPDLEDRLETVLDAHRLFYNKDETWIDSEKLYEVLYELEV
jgi:hypothetical protein